MKTHGVIIGREKKHALPNFMVFKVFYRLDLMNLTHHTPLLERSVELA